MSGAPARRSSAELDNIATAIQVEHEAAQSAFRTAVEHAIRCGELLVEAKAQARHGEWGPWLEENFPASQRTAQGYMRLAVRAEDAQALAHLGIEGALRQLAAPKAPGANNGGPAGELEEIDAELEELDRERAVDRAESDALGARAAGMEGRPIPLEMFMEKENLIDRADERALRARALRVKLGRVRRADLRDEFELSEGVGA